MVAAQRAAADRFKKLADERLAQIEQLERQVTLDMSTLRCTRADRESLQLSTVNKEAEQIVKIKKQAIAIELLAHFHSAGRQCSCMAQRDRVN